MAEITAKKNIEFNKLKKRLRRHVGQAIADYNMIQNGDKVMVCLSGGKDSYTLLDILMNLQKHAPIDFEIVAVNLDQKQPDFPEYILPNYLKSIDVPFHIIEKDTYSIVKKVVAEGKNKLWDMLASSSRLTLRLCPSKWYYKDRIRSSS